MPKAQTILLEGCANLKSVATLGLLPSLENFHVGMCVELKSVELNIPKVSRLDLCMLAITNLTIVSKELALLDLNGCQDLESNNMTLSCPKLTHANINLGPGSKLNRKDVRLDERRVPSLVRL